MNKGSFFLTLIDLVVFITTIRFAIANIKSFGQIGKYEKRVFFFSLIFCLFAFWGGDYFHLEKDYFGILHGGEYNLEQIYTYIARISPFYLVFRLFIWGAVIYIAKRISAYLTNYGFRKEFVFFYVTVCLLLFSYARVSLAMSIIVLSVFLFQERKNILLITALLLSSILFHKTAAFGIGVLLLSYLAYSFNSKWFYIGLVLLVPTSLQFLSNQIEVFLTMDPTESSIVNIYSAQEYLFEDAEYGGDGWGIKVANILQRLLLYITAAHYIILRIKCALKKSKTHELPKLLVIIGNMLAFNVIIVTIIYLHYGDYMYVIYYRLLNFSLLPSAIYLAYTYHNNNKSFFSRFIYVYSIICPLYYLIYSTYNII